MKISNFATSGNTALHIRGILDMDDVSSGKCIHSFSFVNNIKTIVSSHKPVVILPR